MQCARHATECSHDTAQRSSGRRGDQGLGVGEGVWEEGGGDLFGHLEQSRLSLGERDTCPPALTFLGFSVKEKIFTGLKLIP